ncbi:M42 family metallopeptidase [Sphingomonas nostoxanthinifaciens]|uniref:M42 family metallopeptidase n=1 Tax=Sphingomonas nostoxanthinifaciens TaxID=2872652 RepID=UPI001CC1E14B|nr:M42 family metallopeptidase [Sphingomonas nostoxanthinifaciens]UAK25378.1 M42 family metallopeptidase [Sphingomonas nostoxanthinifaciens]
MRRTACAIVSLALLATPALAAPGDRSERLLAELSNAGSPPGYEEPVRAIMVRELKPITDKIGYDGLGSVIAQSGSSGPRIMLDVHMDELGGMIRRVTPDGYMTMQMLGGWLDQALPGQRWIIIGANGPVHAVTGIRDAHLVPATSDERNKVVSRDNVFLDVGAKDAAGVAALGVSPGDPVIPDSTFLAMPNGRYVGKAWDDRAGCAVVIEAMRRLRASGHPNQLFIAATVQEEMGMRGAQPAAEAIKPDIAIAIEGGLTSDNPPKQNAEETQGRLGAGPGMFLFDGSALPSRRMVRFVDDTARAKGIPLQHDLIAGYGEDTAPIQKSGTGVPTVNLVVPVRYTHVHNGIMDRADFDGMVDLVVALIQKLDAPTVAKLRDYTPAP